MPRSTLATAAALAAVAVLAAGCGSSGSGEKGTADGRTASSAPSATPSSTPASPTPAGSTAGSTATTAPSGATTRPAPAALHWTAVPGDADDPVTTNGTWTLRTAQQGEWWSLGRGTASARQRSAPAGLQVVDAALDDDWAVVVYGDQDGNKQQRAVVTALASGKETTLDRHSDLPPSSDGSWALDGSTLWHATDHAGAYCLASTDLTSGRSTLSWCAPARHGFTNVLAGAGRTSIMTFDDQQPSCRTVVSVAGTATTPFAGVAACKGAEGAVLGSAADAPHIFSVVPNENRYQQVHVYGSTAAGTTDLGPGVNGTLTVCGSAAYWARDAAGSTPAGLMRWDGSHLTLAYRSQGFLGQPRCAGNWLTILDSGDNGARQLTAAVS